MCLRDLYQARKITESQRTYGVGTMLQTHRRERQLDLLGYRFTGPTANAALLALFAVTALLIAAPILFMRFQLFVE